MQKKTKITFLGCGTSTGVPVISCSCDVCLSDNPKNTRTRSSLFLENEKTKLLVDTGTDLRFQLLREKISKADSVIFTHGHIDHTAGFDETRAFCWQREERLPIYGSPDTLETLNRMFPWAFDTDSNVQGYVRAQGIVFTPQFTIGNIIITPFEVVHASLQTHGFHFKLPSGKSFAYAPDIKKMPEANYDLLKTCNLHIFGGLRYLEHPSHMTVTESCALSKTLQSPLTYLTHLSHDVEYLSGSASLPPGCHFAYDGLSLEL